MLISLVAFSDLSFAYSNMTLKYSDVIFGRSCLCISYKTKMYQTHSSQIHCTAIRLRFIRMNETSEHSLRICVGYLYGYMSRINISETSSDANQTPT